MANKQEQRKVALKPNIHEELKAFTEWSGVPMATELTRLWLRSADRRRFLRDGAINDKKETDRNN